jgi:hypothetical protein
MPEERVARIHPLRLPRLFLGLGLSSEHRIFTLLFLVEGEPADVGRLGRPVMALVPLAKPACDRHGQKNVIMRAGRAGARGEAAFTGSSGRTVWQVDGSNGENKLKVERGSE